jgi:hypothetical protein
MYVLTYQPENVYDVKKASANKLSHIINSSLFDWRKNENTINPKDKNKINLIDGITGSNSIWYYLCRRENHKESANSQTIALAVGAPG